MYSRLFTTKKGDEESSETGAGRARGQHQPSHERNENAPNASEDPPELMTPRTTHALAPPTSCQGAVDQPSSEASPFSSDSLEDDFVDAKQEESPDSVNRPSEANSSSLKEDVSNMTILQFVMKYCFPEMTEAAVTKKLVGYGLVTEEYYFKVLEALETNTKKIKGGGGGPSGWISALKYGNQELPSTGKKVLFRVPSKKKLLILHPNLPAVMLFGPLRQHRANELPLTKAHRGLESVARTCNNNFYLTKSREFIENTNLLEALQQLPHEGDPPSQGCCSEVNNYFGFWEDPPAAAAPAKTTTTLTTRQPTNILPAPQQPMPREISTASYYVMQGAMAAARQAGSNGPINFNFAPTVEMGNTTIYNHSDHGPNRGGGGRDGTNQGSQPVTREDLERLQAGLKEHKNEIVEAVGLAADRTAEQTAKSTVKAMREAADGASGGGGGATPYKLVNYFDQVSSPNCVPEPTKSEPKKATSKSTVAKKKAPIQAADKSPSAAITTPAVETVMSPPTNGDGPLPPNTPRVPERGATHVTTVTSPEDDADRKPLAAPAETQGVEIHDRDGAKVENQPSLLCLLEQVRQQQVPTKDQEQFAKITQLRETLVELQRRHMSLPPSEQGPLEAKKLAEVGSEVLAAVAKLPPTTLRHMDEVHNLDKREAKDKEYVSKAFAGLAETHLEEEEFATKSYEEVCALLQGDKALVVLDEGHGIVAFLGWADLGDIEMTILPILGICSKMSLTVDGNDDEEEIVIMSREGAPVSDRVLCLLEKMEGLQEDETATVIVTVDCQTMKNASVCNGELAIAAEDLNRIGFNGTLRFQHTEFSLDQQRQVLHAAKTLQLDDCTFQGDGSAFIDSFCNDRNMAERVVFKSYPRFSKKGDTDTQDENMIALVQRLIDHTRTSVVFEPDAMGCLVACSSDYPPTYSRSAEFLQKQISEGINSGVQCLLALEFDVQRAKADQVNSLSRFVADGLHTFLKSKNENSFQNKKHNLLVDLCEKPLPFSYNNGNNNTNLIQSIMVRVESFEFKTNDVDDTDLDMISATSAPTAATDEMEEETQGGGADTDECEELADGVKFPVGTRVGISSKSYREAKTGVVVEVGPSGQKYRVELDMNGKKTTTGYLSESSLRREEQE